MCGIVGVFHKDNDLKKDLVYDFLENSLTKMNRRGPDGKKIVLVNNSYATGFVRLAIRDLSENGMQPMQTDCLNYTISFNGEIYNTSQLLKNLNKFSIDFKSTSDTEIILYHFKYFGFIKTIKILDGIFAIAFYDKLKNTLYLSRDRAGVKPLYYYEDNKQIIYSSNYNQTVNNPYVENKQISEDGLSLFLKLGYVPSGFGFFKNSYLLPQGSYLTIVNNQVSEINQYFDYSALCSSKSIEDLNSKINFSVQNQLISDVPIGTFLSGGIDSSIISLFANKFTKINAFNIGFSSDEFDESVVAEKFALSNNINFKKKVFEKVNIKQLLEDNIAAYSEPLSDYSSLPTLLLSKFTKTMATVALSGDGGDELFYGYDRNRKYGNLSSLMISSKVIRLLKFIKSKLINKPLKLPLYELLSNSNKALIESNFITGAKSLSKKIMPNITGNIYLEILGNRDKSINSVKDFQEKLRDYEYYYHLQRILIKVDRASMFHSLEVRVPLLSNSVLESSKQFSFEDCITLSHGKKPLRQLLETNSNDISSLPKKGFTFSIHELINNDNSGLIKKYILKEIPLLDNFLDTNFISLLYNNHINKKNKYQETSWMLWSIFTLKSWYINHIEN